MIEEYAKIRERERYTASPRNGEHPTWVEYQLVAGGKILSRHETLRQAEEALKIMRQVKTP